MRQFPWMWSTELSSIQTKYIVKISKETSHRFVKIMAQGSGTLVYGGFSWICEILDLVSGLHVLLLTGVIWQKFKTCDHWIMLFVPGVDVIGNLMVIKWYFFILKKYLVYKQTYSMRTKWIICISKEVGGRTGGSAVIYKLFVQNNLKLILSEECQIVQKKIFT